MLNLEAVSGICAITESGTCPLRAANLNSDGGIGVETIVVHWPDDKRTPNAMDLFYDKRIDFVVNIPKNLSEGELKNDYTIRRSAVDLNIPIITNARLASAFIIAFCTMEIDELDILSLDKYFK